MAGMDRGDHLTGGDATVPERHFHSGIPDTVGEHPEHPTAEQLTATVQSRFPDVAESTVYRFLDDLKQLGVIDHVHLGHGPAVYHFAEDTHHHLVCQRCHRVIEVPDEALEG